MFDSSPTQAPQHTRQQRVAGAARLAFKVGEGGRSVLADLYQQAPCRVLFPDTDADEPAQAVLLTTCGGLTGGDRLSIDLEAGERTAITITTQAAEKLYKAADGEEDVQVQIHFKVGREAWAEWLAQETILFDRARLRRRFSADLEPGARLLAVESVVFGRSAMGERFDTGRLHDAWRIRRSGKLVWADALQMEGDVATARAAPFGFGGAQACATLVYVGDDAARYLEAMRECLAPDEDLGAATTFDGLLIVRLLADDAARLRAVVMRLAGRLRQLATGLRPQMPRVWSC